MAKDQEKENRNDRINLLSALSLLIGLIALLTFLVLIVLGQYSSQSLAWFGAYIFLSIPIVSILGLITGLAALIKIREGNENPQAQKYAMAGTFVSLITLTIFLLIFWLF